MYHKILMLKNLSFKNTLAYYTDTPFQIQDSYLTCKPFTLMNIFTKENTLAYCA
jgi:hypothetical protein